MPGEDAELHHGTGEALHADASERPALASSEVIN